MTRERSKAKSGIVINLDKDMTLGKIHTRKMSGLLSRKSLSRKRLTREGGSRTRSERQEIATAAAAPVFSSFEAISILKLDSHHFSELLLDPLFLIDFLSDPSPIIATLVTHSLTHSCLLDLIYVTLACDDTKSKLVGVVTVADVDAEKRVDDSLMQIWKLKCGHKAKYLFRL